MRVRNKLLLLNSVIILVFVFLVFLIFYNSMMENRYNELIYSGYRAYAATGHCNSASYDLLFTANLEQASPLWKIKKDLFVNETKGFLKNPLLEEITTRYQESMDMYQSVMVTYLVATGALEKTEILLLTFIRQGDFDDQRNLFEQRNDSPGIASMTNQIFACTNLLNRALEDNLFVLLGTADREMQANRNNIMISSITAGTLAILLATVFILLTTRSLSSRIKIIADSMKSIAGRDFSVRIKDSSRDELGDLSSAINNTLDKLRDAFFGIKTTSEETNALADSTAVIVAQSSIALDSNTAGMSEIHRHYETLAEIIQGSFTQTQQILSRFTGLDEKLEKHIFLISQLSVAIEEIVRSITNIVSMTRGKKELTASVERVIRQGEESSTETNTQIQSILQNLSHIGEVIEIIAAITGQTDLLSMNAAIESAHA
ncbi:MAG: methyl-accepting chemotaxis protein, partial [Spirochaetaceae bacterium]